MAEETKNVEARGKRKERVGEVLPSKMSKTIVVRVQRRFPHPTFKKVVTAFSKNEALITSLNRGTGAT